MKTLRSLNLIVLLASTLDFPHARLALSEQISKSDSPIDLHAYQELMKHEVRDFADLEYFLRNERDWYAIITPPAADFILQQPVFPVIPFSWEHFPKDLPDILRDRCEFEFSVPVYKLRVVEDRNTRQLHFYGSDNEKLFTIGTPADYDPFLWLKSHYPGLYSGRYPLAKVQSYEAMYDPARVELIVTLIPTEYVEPYLYAQNKVLEYYRSMKSDRDDQGGMMRMGESDALRITAMTHQTNGILLELSYPEEFTNTVDVFSTRHLPQSIWQLVDTGLVPDGTNAITWLLQPYKNIEAITFADGVTDTDGDGHPDAQEFLLYGTDPDNDDSFPVTIQGEIAYSGIETGTIHVLMIPEADEDWSIARAISIQEPGPFTSAPVANFAPYLLRAFRDPDGSGVYETWKPAGEYPLPLYLSDNLTNISILVEDVPSIWGTLDYSGTATGDVYIVAVSEHEWDTTYHTKIPWVQSYGSLTGDPVSVSFPLKYSITGLPPGEYYVRAWIDEDGSGLFSNLEEGGQFSLDPVAVSNRVTAVDFTIALDSAGDGIPDWWKMEHFDGPFSQGSGANDDPDGDDFTNAEEYNMNSSPSSTVRNGPQLVEALRRAKLRVNIDDSENCGGSNADPQDRTAVFQVGQLQDPGYILSVTVDGEVENQDSGYDIVTVNDVFFFYGHGNGQECDMVPESKTHEIIAFSGGEIILRYDTVDGMYHVGAHAEVVNATYVATVRLNTETAASIPSDRSRKKLGIGEVVTLSFEPSWISPITWSLDGGGSLSASSGNPITFTAPDKAGYPMITASYSNVNLHVVFTVVEPSHVEAVKYLNVSYPIGTQGAGMLLLITAQPIDVSFAGVQIREVSGPASDITGYFLQYNPSTLYHNSGGWASLDAYNALFDNAKFGGAQSPWSAGSFTWDIPMEWRVSTISYTGTAPNVTQVMTIHDTDGESSVSKLGRYVRRHPDHN